MALNYYLIFGTDRTRASSYPYYLNNPNITPLQITAYFEQEIKNISHETRNLCIFATFESAQQYLDTARGKLGTIYHMTVESPQSLGNAENVLFRHQDDEWATPVRGILAQTCQVSTLLACHFIHGEYQQDDVWCLKDTWQYLALHACLKNYHISNDLHSHSDDIRSKIGALLHACDQAANKPNPDFQALAYLLALAKNRLNNTLNQREFLRAINQLPGHSNEYLRHASIALCALGMVIAAASVVVTLPMSASILAASSMLSGLGLFAYNQQAYESMCLNKLGESISHDDHCQSMIASATNAH
jgi:hypothetical protein